MKYRFFVSSAVTVLLVAGCSFIPIQEKPTEGSTESEKIACSLAKELIIQKATYAKLDFASLKCLFPYPEKNTNKTIGIYLEPTVKHPDFDRFQQLKKTYQHQEKSYQPYITLLMVMPESQIVVNASDPSKIDQNIFIKKDDTFENISQQQLRKIFPNPNIDINIPQ